MKGRQAFGTHMVYRETFFANPAACSSPPYPQELNPWSSTSNEPLHSSSGEEWEANTRSRSEIPVWTVSQRFSHLQWRRLFKESWGRPTTTADFVRGVSWSLLTTVPERKLRRLWDNELLVDSGEGRLEGLEEERQKREEEEIGEERQPTHTQNTDDHACMEWRALDDLSHDVTQCELMICTQVLRSECCARSCARQCQCCASWCAQACSWRSHCCAAVFLFINMRCSA